MSEAESVKLDYIYWDGTDATYSSIKRWLTEQRKKNLCYLGPFAPRLERDVTNGRLNVTDHAGTHQLFTGDYLVFSRLNDGKRGLMSIEASQFEWVTGVTQTP